MKLRTVELLKPHLSEFKIRINDDVCRFDHYLSRTEQRQLLLSEYGKAPKKKIKLKAGMKRLIEDLLRFAICELKGESNA